VKLTAFPFLAKSIEFAHQHAPARWGLNPHTSDGLIRLSVVMTEVLTIGPDSVRVFVNDDIAKKIPAVNSGSLVMEGRDENQQDVYKSSPGSRLIEVLRKQDLRDLLPQLLNAHEENIRTTAKRGGLGRGVKSAHSDDAVREIGAFLGKELPSPFYIYDEQAENVQDQLSSSRLEGAKKEFFSSRYERNRQNREKALEHHGLTCQTCGFNFESFYGEQGSRYIQVHHLLPLSENAAEVLVDPITDLAVVCANCHVMIHRDKSKTLNLEELRGMIQASRSKTNLTKETSL
jgi:5-methylcytosine-specific restriction endonuclease McrA